MLDATGRRYLSLVQSDIARQRARLEALFAEGEVQYDHRRGTLEVRNGNELLQRWDAELLAVTQGELGTLRWGWADLPSGASAMRIDGVIREGRSLALGCFTSDGVLGIEEHEAEALAWAAALLARADGVWSRRFTSGAQYFALFPGTARPRPATVPPSRHPSSAPAPPPRPSGFRAAVTPLQAPSTPAPSAPPAVRVPKLPALGSMLPPTLAPEAALPAELPIRTPSEQWLDPAVRAALAQLEHQATGYQQAVYVVSVEVVQGKLRFHVGLVALDGSIELVVLEPSQELRAATIQMLREDMNEANGRWSRLVVYLARAGDYVSRRIEVRGPGGNVV